MIYRSLIPRPVLYKSPVLRRSKTIVHSASSAAMIDLIVGVIAIGIIIDVGMTLMKSKRRGRDRMVHIVIEEQSKKKSDDEIIIDVDIVDTKESEKQELP